MATTRCKECGAPFIPAESGGCHNCEQRRGSPFEWIHVGLFFVPAAVAASYSRWPMPLPGLSRSLTLAIYGAGAVLFLATWGLALILWSRRR